MVVTDRLPVVPISIMPISTIVFGDINPKSAKKE